MKRLVDLTECQIETLRALFALNVWSRTFKTVREIARERLRMRGWESRERGSRRYFGMYLTSTWKILDELSRKGYVERSDRPARKVDHESVLGRRLGTDLRPYKITKKGKEEIRRELEL